MKTILITWNPQNDSLKEISDFVKQLNEGKNPTLKWSCGNTKSINPNDKFYFFKQGNPPRGIIGSGRINSKPVAGENWDKSNPNKTNYVDLEFETLLNVNVNAKHILNKIELELITQELGVKQHWTLYSSGTSLNKEIAPFVELEWRKLITKIQKNQLKNISKFDYENETPSITERKGFITSRVGQGKYRANLLERWSYRCSVTNLNIPEILIASHIKPWKDSSPKERLDINNGLLLSPTLDALFDKNLITFDENGNIRISKDVLKLGVEQLGIKKSMKLKHISKAMNEYLNHHRKEYSKKTKKK